MGVYSTILRTVPDSEESPEEEKVTEKEQENNDF